jgi:hypothetical protein
MDHRLKLCTSLILYRTLKSSENHNFIIVTLNLVVLKPAISLRCVDQYYAVCSYVWCNVNFVYTIFVCIAMTSGEVTRILKTKLVPAISSHRQFVPLITFLYPIMFLIIIVTCSG